ncbi:hypothetical protein KJ567_07545 [Candidatus Bipolaricaulota bacterium]|nr:hypothetical protein [Candidatus Bipolaricaulota bacterium]
MKRALVLSLICVVGLAFAGFAQTLTGSWDTEVCLDPQTDNWPGAITLDSTLIVTYAIGDWAFTTTTVLDNTGWVDQDFSVTGLFGLITVSSALGFTVPAGGFDSWTTTLGLNMAGVSFGAVFALDGAGSSLVLTGSAGIGSDVVGSVELELGDGVGCDFDFVGITIGLDFLFCDCAPIASEIYFSCLNGFEYVEFATSGIAIPNLPWVTIGALLHFELQTKEITITPTFDFGAIVCFDLFFEVAEDAGATYPLAILDLDVISIVGIGIGCTIGGVDFYALSMFDGSIRDGAYWEQYSIDVGADACCGGVFEFGLDMFFDNAGATLFEVALIEVDMKVNLTSQFAFTMALDVDVDGGFTNWCLGFEVTW